MAAQTAEARNEAFQKAIEQLSGELSMARLGTDFLEKNKKRFESEVLANSAKYILSVRGKGFSSEIGESLLTVELGYSQEAFDRVLRETGLMQLSQNTLRALVFIEDKNQAVGIGPWWAKPNGKVSSESEAYVKALSAQLGSRGIEVVSSKDLIKSLSPEFRKANLDREELVQLGDQFGASLVFFGLISSGQKGKIFHGQWIQVPAKRILEEVQGEEESLSALVAAILNPIISAQTQGTISSKPFLLTIRGDELTPKDLSQLKSQVISGVRDLRSLKDRVIQKGRFTFEAESSQAPEALVNLLKTLSFQDFQHSASLNDGDEILLQVKRR